MAPHTGPTNRAKKTTAPKPKAQKQTLPAKSESGVSWFAALLVLTCAILWVGHSIYIYYLFENDRFFSHLSDMEREMSYRTEMGLYFSYFKTIVQARSFSSGIQQIMHDNVTEAGHTINTLQRFNLYPEVYLGAVFRILDSTSRFFDLELQSCFQINRGHGMPPVVACEGIGNMHEFYVKSVFALAGGVLPAIFLIGTFLSDSYFGGLLSAVAFVVNHGHATRVQWTPPLRESFGYPMFILQVCVLTGLLRKRHFTTFWNLVLIFLTVHFILFWQFSGFVLFTQMVCIVGCYSLEVINRQQLKSVIKSYSISFIISFALLFGNKLLLSSLWFTSILAANLLAVLRPILGKIPIRSLFLSLNLIIFFGITFGLKFFMNSVVGIKDDNHVFDILRAKFTGYQNFHTQLYICAAEFDFIDAETIKSLLKSGLLPLVAVSFGAVAHFVLRKLVIGSGWRRNTLQNSPYEESAYIVYNAAQIFCFSVVAVLIMRLKLFAVPQFCAFAPVLFNPQLNIPLLSRPYVRTVAVVAIIAAFIAAGRPNVEKQLAIRGEFNNEEQENLFRFIMENTEKDDVFAGSMPVMANVKLTTLRPIFNHPHYEDAGIRDRTVKAYSLYSRKDPAEVHRLYQILGIKYFVYEVQHCLMRKRHECTYLGMFDLIDFVNRNRPPICDRFVEPLQTNSNFEALLPFTVVYNSQQYALLKV